MVVLVRVELVRVLQRLEKIYFLPSGPDSHPGIEKSKDELRSHSEQRESNGERQQNPVDDHADRGDEVDVRLTKFSFSP